MDELLEIKRKECYSENNSGGFAVGENFCELLFDGIMCWPATKGGIEARQSCPAYIMESEGYATKRCEPDGEWFVSNETNSTWTDYSKCWIIIDGETALVDIVSKFENSTLYSTWFPILKKISHWGFGISLATLICSMIIFLSIRKLQCARNRLHMHLFTSFIMRAFMSILKDVLFVEGTAMYSDIIFDNGKPIYITEHYNWTCKAIISARYYFIVANYMLVLMEGVYLHNLMFLKLFSDHNQITLYYILGWGLPLFFIIPWILVRVHHEDTLCWTTSIDHNYAMLIEIPITLSVIINFILFAMILRVLINKLNVIYIQQRKIKYRRLIRSTLTLVPLFGVPYVISLIISYSATTNRTMELIWLFFDQTFTAFQGYFVALVYCLMNCEVHREIKHKYNSLRDRNSSFKRTRTISHTVQFQANTSPTEEGMYEPS